MPRKQIIHSFKIVVLGSYQCGKSSLIQKIERNILAQINTGSAAPQKTKIDLQFTEIDGNERVQVLHRQLFKKARICIVIADINNPNLFVNVQNWFKCAQEYAGKIPTVLVLSKTDQLQSEIEHELQKILKFCKFEGVFQSAINNGTGTDNIQDKIVQLINQESCDVVKQIAGQGFEYAIVRDETPRKKKLGCL
ncbi:Rab2a [Hexamita inflata]|uniref:Rab2a n=1 Tax=Hexamita inflata TaxID=28002 RepID=A0ABP1GDS7_9EUKA